MPHARMVWVGVSRGVDRASRRACVTGRCHFRRRSCMHSSNSTPATTMRTTRLTAANMGALLPLRCGTSGAGGNPQIACGSRSSIGKRLIDIGNDPKPRRKPQIPAIGHGQTRYLARPIGHGRTRHLARRRDRPPIGHGKAGLPAMATGSAGSSARRPTGIGRPG